MADTFIGETEVFWVGVQAICAIVGSVVVFMYTLYTRKMMKLQEESRRAELAPIFSVRQTQFISAVIPSRFYSWKASTESGTIDVYNAHFRVGNIGKGPAILLRAWHQPVSSSFNLDNIEHLVPTQIVVQGNVSTSEAAPGGSFQVDFVTFYSESRWLFVIEGNDSANGNHQLQILREVGNPAPIQ